MDQDLRQQQKRNCDEIDHRAGKEYAVNIRSEKRQHADLENQRQEEEFPEAKREAKSANESATDKRRHRTRKTIREPRGKSAQVYPKLRDLRRMRRVPRHISPASQRLGVRLNGTVQPGCAKRGDATDREEGQLKARIAKLPRVSGEKNERGHGGGVQQIQFPEEATAD